MQITKRYAWNRRDFLFDATCEQCGHVSSNIDGYDDEYYYNNVMPDMKCGKCGESSNSKTTDALQTRVTPKYPAHQIL